MKKKITYSRFKKDRERLEKMERNKEMKQLNLPFVEPVESVQLSLPLEGISREYRDMDYELDPDYYTTID